MRATSSAGWVVGPLERRRMVAGGRRVRAVATAAGAGPRREDRRRSPPRPPAPRARPPPGRRARREGGASTGRPAARAGRAEGGRRAAARPRRVEEVGEGVGAVEERRRGRPGGGGPSAGVGRRHEVEALAERWLPRMAVTVAVADAAADGARGHRRALAAAADHVAQRRAGDQHHRGQQAQHDQDRRCPRRRPWCWWPSSRLADVAAALLDDVRLEPALASSAAQAEAPGRQGDQERHRAHDRRPGASGGPARRRGRGSGRRRGRSGPAARARPRGRPAGGSRPPASRPPGRRRSPGTA